MKKFASRTAAIFALAAFASVAFSQIKDFSTAFYYDLGDKSWAGIVTKQITTFGNILGKGYSLELDGFAGAKFNGGVVAGVALGKHFPLADKASGYVGVGVKVEGDHPVSAGPVFGVTVKF